jgi:hypothetical protein
VKQLTAPEETLDKLQLLGVGKGHTGFDNFHRLALPTESTSGCEVIGDTWDECVSRALAFVSSVTLQGLRLHS